MKRLGALEVCPRCKRSQLGSRSEKNMLPAKEMDAPFKRGSSEKERTIVVVEDDPSLFKLWERLAAQFEGVRFIIFRSPREAVSYLTSNPTDILLTDLTMPEMNGLQLMKMAEILDPKTKIVATSGYIGEESQFSGFHQFVHIIKKPYQSLEHLRQLINLLLQDSNEISNVEVEEEESGYYVWDL